MPEFPLRELIEQYPKAMAAIFGSVVLGLLIVIVAVWLMFGRGPRRRRGLRAARKSLRAGAWQSALNQLKLVRAIGSPSSAWARRFERFEGECLQVAAEAALKDKKFETALENGTRAAQILDGSEAEVRQKVQAAMLQEVRRLFSKQGETRAATDLIGRTLLVQSPCREASFWQALCDLRNGATESAQTNLHLAHTGTARSALGDGPADVAAGDGAPAVASPFIDPPLYLGAVLLRSNLAKDSLRYLTEANRMDANCPFVTLQLGAAIVSAGGDTNMAVRALQRALGPKGFGQWPDDPRRAWVEGMPDNRSHVRKLAGEFPFTCPIFGEDLTYLIRQGNLALAQGQFKLNNFQEAADLFEKVLKEGAPSLLVLRGFGLSLAKLGRFDDAFVHLRTAHEMEQSKDRLTTGYLALCGACGKPARPEDRVQNTAWAIRLVTPFNAPGDAEWIGILNRIFAEARQIPIPISSDDQLHLCEHLVSVKACDAVAAQAYHHLMATEPKLVSPEYAWLYCWADRQHDVDGEKALALYTMTFAHQDAARAFFAEQGWNFEDVERKFLQRAAEQAPGRFPEILGADYAGRGEELLLAHSRELEEAGQHDAALADIEILVRLWPHNTSAADRAAALHFRASRLAPALELLELWHRTQPNDPLPLVRQALVLNQQGQVKGCYDKLREAMARADGQRRANIAFVGARVALQHFLLPGEVGAAGDLATVQDFLGECLASDANHPHALWCQAAVRWLQGDKAALAKQSAAMRDACVADPRYHYLAALCHLLDDKLEAVLVACERAVQHAEPAASRNRNGTTTQLDLAVEAGYLAALADIELGQPRAAIDALNPLAHTPGSPTQSHAQALLGNVLFDEEAHDEAIEAWQALDAKTRQAWGLTEPLAQTTFISAADALLRGEYEAAGEKFRQAGRLGCRDRRLGPLLLLALFKAGQQAVYAGETATLMATTHREVVSER